MILDKTSSNNLKFKFRKSLSDILLKIPLLINPYLESSKIKKRKI